MISFQLYKVLQLKRNPALSGGIQDFFSQVRLFSVTLTVLVTYKSGNKKIATVSSNGTIKGIKKGTAKITVTCNGVTKTVKVTVK